MLRLCSHSSRLRAEALQRAGTFLSGEICPALPLSYLKAAPCMATCRVTGQKSAKAIVGAGRRPKAIGRLETSPAS